MKKKEFKRKRNYRTFLVLLSALCRAINKKFDYIGENPQDNSYLVLVYKDRHKRIDISNCSDFRMIAIEVLKYINGA